MDRIIILFTDGVISLRGRRNGVIYDDLKQVQVGIDGSNLFQAILKFVIVVDAAHIKKGRETWNFATALASALSICSWRVANSVVKLVFAFFASSRRWVSSFSLVSLAVNSLLRVQMAFLY